MNDRDLAALSALLNQGKAQFQENPEEISAYIFLTLPPDADAAQLRPSRRYREDLLSRDPERIKGAVTKILHPKQSVSEKRDLAAEYVVAMEARLRPGLPYTSDEVNSIIEVIQHFEAIVHGQTEAAKRAGARELDLLNRMREGTGGDVPRERGASARSSEITGSAQTPILRSGTSRRRRLTQVELAEARLVFGASLDYSRVFVFEGATWVDFVDAFGAYLTRRRRQKDSHNAITVGDTSYFPIQLRTDESVLAAGDLSHMTWLIHELTHQWQYQHFGWRSFAESISVQIAEGRRSYDYAREHGTRETALKEAAKLGRKFTDFNPEQQGDIARDYYFYLKTKRDPSPWQPFLDEVRKASRNNSRPS